MQLYLPRVEERQRSYQNLHLHTPNFPKAGRGLPASLRVNKGDAKGHLLQGHSDCEMPQCGDSPCC